MISRTTISLAVALPLVVCILVLLAICTILLVRLRRQQSSIQQTVNDTSEPPDQRPRSSRRLRRESRDAHEFAVSQEELHDAYSHFVHSAIMYARNWIADDDSPRNDSAARIEAILYPEPLEPHPMNDDVDVSIFTNPHEYTTMEICSLLESNADRTFMAAHILTAVLLKSVLLHEGGDRFLWLLPMLPHDGKSLAKLQRLIRGVPRM